MSFKPTQEQDVIVEAYAKSKSLKVSAAAGSGKTSTIVLMANADLKRRGLYMAFNKSIAEEVQGKVPSNIESRTTHSMAYAAIGKHYREKLSRPKTGYVNVAVTPLEIARFFKIGTFEHVSEAEVAYLVKRTVTRFEQSADDHLNEKNIPHYELNDIVERANDRDEVMSVDRKGLVEKVMLYANKLWNERIDTNSQVMITHDTYLKLYQLSKPQLSYDVIFLDEAQDSSPCVVDIINQQTKAQVIVVGDSSQAIYQWRGSVDAMNMFNFDELFLTQSFRFGQAIADIANTVLEGTAKFTIKGNPNTDSVVGMVDESLPYTIISRTNGSLIGRAISLIDQGKSVDLKIDVRGFVRLLEEAHHLFQGNMKKVKHEELIGFKNWQEFVDEAEEGNADFKRIAKMIHSGHVDKVLSVLVGYSRPRNPDVTLVTAHKSKGMEWDQVVLDGDFPEIDESNPNVAEINLKYVAATRAMMVLQLSTGDPLWDQV